MKIKLQKKTYNTETATILVHTTYGNFGETTGYEENLYKTKKGDYFIHGLGGQDSKYPVETITPITPEEAKVWKKEHKQ